MNRRISVGRFFGIEVQVDWSWIALFVVAAWTLVTLNRRLLPDLGAGTLTLASTAAAAGLFASLGAHQLVRVLRSRTGVKVRRLTLFAIGGMTDRERYPASPRAEAWGALLAPAASVALAAVLAFGVLVSSAPGPRSFDDLDRLGTPGVVLLEIAFANLVIAVVNFLPAYPLDGGRLLRAALWKLTGDIDRATWLSACAGQIVGWTLVVVGIGLVLGGGRSVLGAGVCTAVVGWFIASAAAQSYEGATAKRAMP